MDVCAWRAHIVNICDKKRVVASLLREPYLHDEPKIKSYSLLNNLAKDYRWRCRSKIHQTGGNSRKGVRMFIYTYLCVRLILLVMYAIHSCIVHMLFVLHRCFVAGWHAEDTTN